MTDPLDPNVVTHRGENKQLVLQEMKQDADLTTDRQTDANDQTVVLVQIEITVVVAKAQMHNKWDCLKGITTCRLRTQ
jgi:hypothetical protein